MRLERETSHLMKLNHFGSRKKPKQLLHVMERSDERAEFKLAKLSNAF